MMLLRSLRRSQHIGRQNSFIMANANPFSQLLGQKQQSTFARLAVLQPATERDDPIKIALTEANLAEASYECISYDHAEDADTTTVSVDGNDQDVPKALESALRTFRRKEKPRTLWADLLVGRTVEERSAQSIVIRQILENAEKTLCWIGPGNESTTKAFETVHEMANRWTQACLHAGISTDTNLSRITMQQLDVVRARLNNCRPDDLNSFDFAHWKEVYAILGARYWNCVQCIPEIVLAKLAVVVCGRSNIRWPNYIAASRAMPFFQAKFFRVPLLPSVKKGFEIANSIELAERRRRLGETIELFPMIQTARDCGAKDAREYVFSMVHIATPSARIKSHNQGRQPLPTVDYTKSAQQVFTEAARYIVLERQDLMLWYGERVPCAKKLKDLPSWVPDFGAMALKGREYNLQNGLRLWWDSLAPVKPITVSDDNVLHVQAHALDRVAYVSPVFNVGNCGRLCVDEFLKLPAPTGGEPAEQRDERFWRTLILNIGGRGNTLRDNLQPGAVSGASFRSLVAQERVLKMLDCSPDQLRTPEIQARIGSSPEVQALLPQCGKSQPYEALLGEHAIGRRFFRTEGGRFGMTAVEDIACVDPTLRDEVEEIKASSPSSSSSSQQGPSDKPRAPDFGSLLADPMARMMMGSFQDYLRQKDPKAARAYEKALRGELPGQQETPDRIRGGVSEGDVVVALVGGFFPYMLRPHWSDVGSGTQLARADSTYEFVGDCYLHGSMEGEDFQVAGAGEEVFYRTDVSKLVDISIV
ncbi:hypothetical protein F5X96DRAFT_648246 [Biscogniauxia mediterranea]|nr:hypothetical protein F5X96DRAFT_648246 [Biscogniauxia mediterranea]